MAKEPRTDYEGITGKVIWETLRFVWKVSLMCLWGFLRLTEVVTGQLAKYLKPKL